jgi:6-phosphogluconolactonase
LLGLGTDGHTASLFPGALGLDAAFDDAAKTCVALTALRSDVTGDEIERMSLSAKAIADARHVALMITGDVKKQVLEVALEPASELPIGRLHKMRPFDIYWAP